MMKLEIVGPLLLLSLCCLAYAQTRDSDATEPTTRCSLTSAKELVDDGCAIGCVTITRDSFPCYFCSSDCVTMEDECNPDNASSCSTDRLCVAAGTAGRYTCVERYDEGERCDGSDNDDDNDDDEEDDDDDGDEFLDDDFFERYEEYLPDVGDREFISKLDEVTIPCKEGLVCRREALDRRVCRTENQTSRCVQARDSGSNVMCDEDGEFIPRQCKKLPDSQRYNCRCVQPDGTLVPGSEVTVDNLDDAPNCEREGCKYRSSLGYAYRAPSGFPFIDVDKCRQCLCDDGDARFCVSLDDSVCDRINPQPALQRACRVKGKMLRDGDSTMVGCNRCQCRNGRPTCLRTICGDSDEDEDDEEPEDEGDKRCHECSAMRANPVCGRDGRTYPSECFALNCRELSAEDIAPGPCSRKDVCLKYPCNGTEICLRRGGVTCLTRSGCRNARRFRTCVDLQTLQCKRRADSDTSDDTAVCGSDGVSYSSVCSLIQASAQLQVSFAGKCTKDECSGGEVCGTDGETYSNICELQTQSANARVDYAGECTEPDDPETPVRDRCRTVRSRARCEDVSDCVNVIQPEDGCCPICGGGLTIGFDRDALEDYINLNPSLETVDDLLMMLIAAGFIKEDDLRRCNVTASLLSSGDLYLALKAVSKSDTFCNQRTEDLVDRINNPPRDDGSSSTTATVSTSNPQILQFATVAQSSAVLSGSVTTTNGGQRVVKVFSSLIIILPIMMITLFF